MKIICTLFFLICSTFLFAQISKEELYDEMMAYGKEELLKKVAEIGDGKLENKFYNSDELNKF